MAVRYLVALSEEQVEVLYDILEMWIESLDETEEDTEKDLSIDSVEDLLKAIGGLNQIRVVIESVMKELEWIKRGPIGTV